MAKCGGYKSSAEWAKNDPEGLIKAMNKNGRAAALINKASPQVLKGFMGAVGRDLMNPFGWLGGEIIFSTMFSADAEQRGKTPLEALDEGVLWFLPKGVIDAQKKALFGYEGLPTNQRFKMEGYAGAYSADQIKDMKNYLDMEDADREYWVATDKRKNFETMRFDSETGKKRVLDKIDAAIEKHGKAAHDAVMNIYENNTGLRTDGVPRYEDMYREDLDALVTQTGANLWDVQQQYAIDQINRAKQGKLNTLYAQKEDIWDVPSEVTHATGITEKGQIPFFGERGRISTAITDPIDVWRASEEFENPVTTPGIKQLLDPLYTLSNIEKISQEEKERYAIEQGQEDLLYPEYKHPIYGPSFSYEQIKEVYPEYFEGAEGGIASLKKK